MASSTETAHPPATEATTTTKRLSGGSESGAKPAETLTSSAATPPQMTTTTTTTTTTAATPTRIPPVRKPVAAPSQTEERPSTAASTDSKRSPPPISTSNLSEKNGPPSRGSNSSDRAGAEGAAPPSHDDQDGTNPLDFAGSVDTTNLHQLPTLETIKKIDKHLVLDRNGKSHTFRSLYTGRHVARRVLVIFVRHFYCGNCQQYLNVLSRALPPQLLLSLPIPTFIVVIGCGDPGLIDMYVSETSCPFPVYADPTRKLYQELGMVRTLALGQRPAYMQSHIIKSSVTSVFQGLKQIKSGLALKGGDQRQIGGEFLFEPLDMAVSPLLERGPILGRDDKDEAGPEQGIRHRDSETPSIDGKNMELGGDGSEGVDKGVVWCHRMRNTRDHAEIPELMEVLGVEEGMLAGLGLGEEPKGEKEKERWEKARRERKGTGFGGKRASGMFGGGGGKEKEKEKEKDRVGDVGKVEKVI